MISEKLITRSYVRTEGGEEYLLEYYLCEESNIDKKSFGLTVRQKSAGVVTSESEFLSHSEEQALEMILCFASSFVFPSTLPDLLDDLRDVQKVC